MTSACPILSLSRGFGLGASLIVAIGAQNAFVLRQGLKRQRVLLIVSICTLCDAVLLLVGAEGFGSLVAKSPQITRYASWAGIAFLLAYGLRAFASAFRPKSLTVGEESETPPNAVAVATQTLAFSLLNPHVYLDTVVLMGSISAQYPKEGRWWFTCGAMFASFAWFFSLGFGATKLSPFFRKPISWRILDCLIGLIMWGIAFSLFQSTT
jgi:L-lysine exporter family protein LysE/ArgO